MTTRSFILSQPRGQNSFLGDYPLAHRIWSTKITGEQLNYLIQERGTLTGHQESASSSPLYFSLQFLVERRY